MKYQTKLRIRVPRWLGWLAVSACFVAFLFFPTTMFPATMFPATMFPAKVLAQGADPNALPPMNNVLGDSATLPSYWFLIMAALGLLVPAGFVLVGVAGLDPSRAWDAALGALAAIGLASFGYWAVGFALQFGGVGLVYAQPGLRDLVWEWSPFAADWGAGWGVAGLSGWFLAGANITPLAYALFLAHVPWAITAAMLPIVALRGRAPATATLILALVLGGVIYPLAGNWVRGGGWLGALGNNLNLGHGFVDFGGAGMVHLVVAGVALAALVVWVPRRAPRKGSEPMLHPAQLPLLAVVGSLLILVGSFGWLWANPLQMTTMSEVALLRGSVNTILFAGGGILVPLLYTWFVTGKSEPLTSARGLAAGVVAGMAVGPFVQPGQAFAIGLVAGATVPFVTYLLPLFNTLLRIQQFTGILMINIYWGMILPWVVFPFGVFLMRQAMFSIPSDLLDAARMDGATEFNIYWRIVVPLVRTSIAALAIIVFIFKYDDLLWPLVVAQRSEMYPITVGLVEYVGQFFVEYHLFTTASVLAILPIFVIYLILQRYIIEGIATQGLKG